jgi:predicted  nucleic acid-binding Zn-ribbon protein
MSSVSAEGLRELHRIHKQLTDLRGRVERGPKQIQAGEAGVRLQEQDMKQAKENYTKARVNADEKQLQLRQREARIADLKGKLNACSTNREYQALKEQIAADEQANRVLEDEILEALEQLDVLQRNVGDSELSLKKIKAELEKCRQRVAGEQSGLEAELARVTQSLRDAEARLPADFRAEYERIARVKGENALAQVEGDVCGGCYQILTAQMINELRMERPLWCKSCGCLLYLPERRN